MALESIFFCCSAVYSPLPLIDLRRGGQSAISIYHWSTDLRWPNAPATGRSFYFEGTGNLDHSFNVWTRLVRGYSCQF